MKCPVLKCYCENLTRLLERVKPVHDDIIEALADLLESSEEQTDASMTKRVLMCCDIVRLAHGCFVEGVREVHAEDPIECIQRKGLLVDPSDLETFYKFIEQEAFDLDVHRAEVLLTAGRDSFQILAVRLKNRETLFDSLITMQNFVVFNQRGNVGLVTAMLLDKMNVWPAGLYWVAERLKAVDGIR